MQRRSFIKDVFGGIIGVAFLPTAITQFASQPELPIKEICNWIYLDTSKFLIGDIITVDGDDMYVLVRNVMGEFYGKHLTQLGYQLTLKHRDGVKNPKIQRVTSAFIS